jgi:hypothetical protein
MMPSKILSALSPTLLTLMLLANPQLAIMATFFMGFVSGLLLVWVQALFRIRNPKSPGTGPMTEVN